MIPELERAFGRLVQLQAMIRSTYQRLETAGHAPEGADFRLDPPGAGPEVVDDLASLKTLLDAMNEQIHALAETGCVVKDIDSGLADWYAKENGRDIFLCWKLGEKEVAFWHEIDAGFSGRRSVVELSDKGVGSGV